MAQSVGATTSADLQTILGMSAGAAQEPDVFAMGSAAASLTLRVRLLPTGARSNRGRFDSHIVRCRRIQDHASIPFERRYFDVVSFSCGPREVSSRPCAISWQRGLFQS
jgi:hypothetical protein